MWWSLKDQGNWWSLKDWVHVCGAQQFHHILTPLSLPLQNRNPKSFLMWLQNIERIPKLSEALQPSHRRFLSTAEKILESPNIVWYCFEIPMHSLSYTNFMVISFIQPILHSIKGQILSHWKYTPSKNGPGHIFLEGCNFLSR